MFWFVASLIFSVLYGTNLLFSSKFFQSFEYDGKSISFQLYWSVKDLIFNILGGSSFMFWKFNATVKVYWKQLLSLFFGFIVAFLFFIHSGESIYDLPLFRLICNLKVVIQ